MSLKKFHTIFVLLSLSVMVLLYLYIAHLLDNNISTHVKNSIKGSSLDLRHQLRSDFDLLDLRFTQYETISLEKLKYVTQHLSEQSSESNLTTLAESINVNVFDGHYEIYVINKNKVIEKSTSKADIGLDYKDYHYFSETLDQLKARSIEHKISAPTFDEFALDIGQYYIMNGTDGTWIMLGYILPFDEYVNRNIEKLQALFPSLQKLDLFILTYGNLQHIGTEIQPKKDFGKTIEENQHYLVMIMEDLGLTTADGRSDIEQIATSFSEQEMRTFHKESSQETTVYSLTKSSSEHDSDDFMLITKMQFDQTHFLSEFTELKNLMYLFITLVITLMVLGFGFIYKAVIQKISMIVLQMKQDEPIIIEGYLFSEFSYFIQRYNNFMLRWKEEIRRLHEVTMQDELTKCHNRRYFNVEVQKQIELHKRYGLHFSMLMFDIDDFKKINDTHGHGAGDFILQSIVNDVRSQIRMSDVLCRIGGEEFAILLLETDMEAATHVAEKIRAFVASQIYIDREHITISIGVENYSDKYDFNSFYTSVDELLYESKNSGKNRVSSGS